MTARPWILLGVFVLAAALLVLPTGFGHTNGMARDVASDFPDDFNQNSCTSCHGTKGLFNPGEGVVTWTIDGKAGLPGNAYEASKAYTIHIALANEQNADATNRAGFNLIVTAGTLAPVEGNTQVGVSDDGTQATHLIPTLTSWDVMWTAPEAGAVAFTLSVNDVDGNGAPDATDQVHRAAWWFTDHEGAQLGAAAEVHEIHYGISLQQYWIGLLGLAGMIFIMVAAYVYLKYVAPHNTDEKAR